MISEGSCDTEDWSNDAENSALITGINDNLKYNNINKLNLSLIKCNSNLNCNNISQKCCFFGILIK